jgi:hypothetical protein
MVPKRSWASSSEHAVEFNIRVKYLPDIEGRILDLERKGMKRFESA